MPDLPVDTAVSVEPMTLIVFVPGLESLLSPKMVRWIQAAVRPLPQCTPYRARVLQAMDRYSVLLAELKKIVPNSQVIAFEYPNWFGARADAEEEAGRLAAMLETEARSFDRVVVVGYSFGALLARKAMLLATRCEGGFGWLDKTERLVLLAGANRGFRPSLWWHWVLYWLALQLQNLPWPSLRLGHLALAGMRGSPWITGLRVDWVRRFEELGRNPPSAVQVRGKKDRVVSQEDSCDIFHFKNTVPLTVKEAGHGHFTLVPKRRKYKDQKTLHIMEDIRKTLIEALGPEPLRKTEPEVENQKLVTVVVFLLHGIRDLGDWHDTLAWTIRREADSLGKNLEIVSVRYGYFSALQFLFPRARKRCVPLFLDRWAEMEVRHPGVEIHAAAHSNGTWVLAHGLESCTAVRLKNVYLAGSVLPKDFDWDKLVLGRGESKPQIEGWIRNDCASADWPVGVLCRTLNFLGKPLRWPYQEIGTAGVDGFEGPPAKLTNNQYLRGGHGAALETSHHPGIAQFLLKGSPVSPTKLRALDCCGLARSWILLVLVVVLVLGAFWGVTTFPPQWAQESVLSVYLVATSAAMTLLVVALLLLM